ncbi:MAG: DUF4340 domain-containing protein, partial [Gemmatimonadetes bacterium]|nr:DUF4340 domain-containing protein [Gemmatimonadota bacterium]
TGPERTVTLERANDEWTVNGFLADSTAVARFWDALSESEIGDVAATNPANHERLGITADSAWVLTIGQEERVLLGHAGPQFGTAYVRLPDADEVYLLRGDLRSATTRSLVDWRDKLVLSVDTARVTAVEVTRDGDTRRWERGDGAWTVGGQGADETEVRNLLQELAAFRATGFAADSITMKETPDRRILAFDAEGNEMASLALDEGDGNLRAFSSQSPYVFQVPSWRADRIAPEGGDGN